MIGENVNFGQISAEALKIGDMVSWAKWECGKKEWIEQFGVILDIKNELKSNRMVCISVVLPLKNSNKPIELFTFSLKLISSGHHKEA
jgi:hypothetical protein